MVSEARASPAVAALGHRSRGVARAVQVTRHKGHAYLPDRATSACIPVLSEIKLWLGWDSKPLARQAQRIF